MLEKSKEEISRYCKFLQPLNILSIFSTEDVSRNDKSINSICSHPSNILSIFSTNDVLKFENSTSFNDEQP